VWAQLAEADAGQDGGGEGGSPHLELDGFSGPLALLLSLARAQQIGLARLPVAKLVDQLVNALQEAGPSLGERGTWLVMACWLLLLRSRLLLPADAPAQQEAEEAADQLRGHLLALQAGRVLAGWLDRRPQLGRDVFARGQPEPLGAFAGVQHRVDVIEFLWAAMGLFDDGTDETDAVSVYRPRWAELYAVGDARERILRQLAEVPEGGLLGWFLPSQTGEDSITIPAELLRRSAWTSTFMASLELAKQGDVALAQDAVFAPIHMRWAAA
jgi:segregation and condensation protein A